MTDAQTSGERRDTERYTGLLPPLSADEYEALKADIAERGCLVPVELDEDGRLLDGAHRTRACRELGIDPPKIERVGLADDQAKRDYARKINLIRRHLTTKAKRDLVADALRETPERSDRQIAGAVGVSHVTVGKVRVDLEATGQVDQLTKRTGADGKERRKPTKPADAPRESVFDIGDAPTRKQADAKAKRDEKEAERKAARQANEKKVAATDDIGELRGTFATIVIDPPWDFGDEGDVDQFGRGRPTYATLTAEQVAELPVAEIAADDAHLYLWITNRSLPKGFALLEAWGFRYITCLTWVKPSFGMGNYFRGSTEQVLFGVRGSLPLDRKDAPTHLSAPRGPDGHSSKPDAFYELVRTCSPAPRIDYFGRRNHTGFTTYGEDGLAA